MGVDIFFGELGPVASSRIFGRQQTRKGNGLLTSDQRYQRKCTDRREAEAVSLSSLFLSFGEKKKKEQPQGKTALHFLS